MFAQTKFNTIKVLKFKALSDSYVNHGKFVSVNIKTMETCYGNYKKSTANKNPSIRRTKQNRNRLVLASNSAAWAKKQLRIIKNQNTSGLKLH